MFLDESAFDMDDGIPSVGNHGKKTMIARSHNLLPSFVSTKMFFCYIMTLDLICFISYVYVNAIFRKFSN
jgi:hypothetical protein